MSNAIAEPAPSSLAQLLADPERLQAYPVETVERLFALDREMQSEHARREFAIAFNAVQSELTPVHKAARNPSTGSFYARLEDIEAMLDPILTRHGFSRSISATDCPLADHMRFVLRLRHNGGHVEEHYLDAPIDDKGIKGSPTKTRLQGMASSYTYCERHLLVKVFGVQTSSDADGAALLSEEERAEIDKADAANVLALIEEVGADVAKFCTYFKIPNVAALPRHRLKAAIRMLEAKR